MNSAEVYTTDQLGPDAAASIHVFELDMSMTLLV